MFKKKKTTNQTNNKKPLRLDVYVMGCTFAIVNPKHTHPLALSLSHELVFRLIFSYKQIAIHCIHTP